jgi:hypothetical protein
VIAVEEVPFVVREYIRGQQRALLEMRTADYRPTRQDELDDIETRAVRDHGLYREFVDAIGPEQFVLFCGYEHVAAATSARASNANRSSELARGRAEVDAGLARMQRVLEDAKAEGKTSLTREEFWRRHQALGDGK